mgnify:FL=1
MEDQVASSQEYQVPVQSPTPQPQQPGVQFNIPDFQAMRQEAMAKAVQQVTGQPMANASVAQPQPKIEYEVAQFKAQQQVQPQSKVVYVRRNLTLAELILVFTITSLGVIGVQAGWNFATDVLPRIEIRDK